jgi:DNA polymerase II small subunit
MDLDDRLHKAISYTIEAGYQLDKDAFEFLNMISEKEDPIKFIEKAVKKFRDLSQQPLFISRNFLENLKNECNIDENEKSFFNVKFSNTKSRFRPYAKDVGDEIKVLMDPTKKICTTGSIREYLEYFQDRFERLKKILKKRIDVKNAITILSALNLPVKTKINIIGMITEKIESNKRVFIKIEDLEATASVLVSKNLGKDVVEKARSLLLDQVICVKGIKGNNDLIIAQDFILPEVPLKNIRKAPIPVSAALISDLHIGSNKFMTEEFNRFLLWLRGKYGNDKSRQIAGQIKYLVIAGDIVDGIGVYPNQLEELKISDIYEQYEEAAKFLEKVPDYIKIIIIPGNHDASRKALPQPAIPEEYIEPLKKAHKIHSLGSPSTISLHGVELLLFHGRSLDDVASVAPNINFNTPDKSMKLLLQARHLAPTYGKRTPISPEKKDFMVVDSVPDIFHAGHVHVLKCNKYRGTLIINSGAWQEQTDFQLKMGLRPTPGIIPVVNLQSSTVTKINFTNK